MYKSLHGALVLPLSTHNGLSVGTDAKPKEKTTFLWFNVSPKLVKNIVLPYYIDIYEIQVSILEC